MASHTKPASTALQLVGVLLAATGLFTAIVWPAIGGTLFAIGACMVYSGGRSIRQRIIEDQS